MQCFGRSSSTQLSSLLARSLARRKEQNTGNIAYFMSSDEQREMKVERGIEALGSDQIQIVLQFLPVPAIVAFGLTCHRFYDLVNSDALWAKICRREWGDAVVDAWPNSRQRKRGWKQLYGEMLFCGAVAWHCLSASGDRSLPVGRASHSMSNVAGEILVFGGGCEGGRALCDTWVATLPSNSPRGIQWRQLQSLENPPARFGHSCVALDETLLLFGGINDTGTRLLDTWIYTSSSQEPYHPHHWRLLHVARSPIARGAHACCHAGEKRVVLFGGIRHDSVRLSDTWLLDLSQDPPAWQELLADVAPSPRSGHTLSWTGGRVVLFGGRGAHFEVLNDVWTLHVEGRRARWSQLAATEPPPPRAGHSASPIFGNRILIFGGEDARRSKKRDVWVLDPDAAAPAGREMEACSSTRGAEEKYARRVWRKLRVRGQAPGRRSFHGACALETGHALLVFGGMVDDAATSGVVFNSDLFLLQLIP